MRVVLVGAGRWGSNIARVLKELELGGIIELGHVVDLNLERALELSRKYGFSGAKISIDDVEGEAFVIATAIESLYITALRAIDLSHCVFVEKPASQSSREVAELLTRAESRGVVHQVGYISRFDPTIIELRRYLQDRQPYALYFRRLSRRPPNFLKYPVTLDLTSHDVDLAFYLLKPRSVDVLYSVLAIGWGVPQKVIAGLFYDSVDVRLETDGLIPVKIREVDVFTEEEFVRADLVAGTITSRSKSGTSRIDVSGEEPLKKELEIFIRRCRGEDIEAPDLRDALNTMRVIEEITSRASRISCRN